MSQKIKLTPETLGVLRNFSGINEAIIIREGDVVTTVSKAKSVVGVAKLNQSFESEFGIHDLRKFLATLSLFTDPELVIGDKIITISEDGRKVSYQLAQTKHVQSITPTEVEGLDKLVDKGKVSFSWKNDVFQKVQKALTVLRLPVYQIQGDGSNIHLRAVSPDASCVDSYDVQVGETDQTFSAIFKAENIRSLPLDYDVKLLDKTMARFSNDEAGLRYYVVAEAVKR